MIIVSREWTCIRERDGVREKNHRRDLQYKTWSRVVSFVALCVLNKCQKVIPHSVITWSFFHFGAHSLEQEISHHIPEWKKDWKKERKKSEIKREMQRFLAAQLYFCFSLYFFPSFTMSLSWDVLHIFWVSECVCVRLISTATYGLWVRLNWTKELMKNHYRG